MRSRRKESEVTTYILSEGLDLLCTPACVVNTVTTKLGNNAKTHFSRLRVCAIIMMGKTVTTRAIGSLVILALVKISELESQSRTTESE